MVSITPAFQRFVPERNAMHATPERLPTAMRTPQYEQKEDGGKKREIIIGDGGVRQKKNNMKNERGGEKRGLPSVVLFAALSAKVYLFRQDIWHDKRSVGTPWHINPSRRGLLRVSSPALPALRFGLRSMLRVTSRDETDPRQ